MQNPSYIILTGASSGIGRATLDLLLKKGHWVVGTSRDVSEPVLIHERCIWIALDLTSSESRDSFIKKIVFEKLNISGLINNAGYGLISPFEGATEEEMRHQMEANFFGTTLLTQAIIPHLLKNESWAIVTVTSIGGRMVFPYYGYYHASKHALEWLFEALWFELESTGVRVHIVEPGFTRTDFLGRSQRIGSIPVKRLVAPIANLLKRLGSSSAGSTPDVIAQVIVRAFISKSRSLRYTGGYLSSLLILRQILPERIFRWLIASSTK